MLIFTINEECTQYTTTQEIVGFSDKQSFVHDVDKMSDWDKEYHSDKITDLINAVKKDMETNQKWGTDYLIPIFGEVIDDERKNGIE